MNANQNPNSFGPIPGAEAVSHYAQAVASPLEANAIRPSQGNGEVSYRIALSAGSAFVGVGWSTVSAADAVANSALPTAGSPKQCIVMSPGATETFTLPNGVWLSFRSASNCDAYVLAGAGV
jgi:hypothetical protein